MEAQATQLTLDRRWLHLPYGIVPLCILVVAVDALLLNQRLAALLPRDPHSLFAFSLFFELPHILASAFIVLGHADYRRHFQRSLLYASLAAACFALPIRHALWFSLSGAAFGLWTLVHVLRQQLALAGPLAGLRGQLHQLWMGSAIAFGLPVYLLAYSRSSFTPEWSAGLELATYLLWALFALCCAEVLRRTRTRRGFAYVAFNCIAYLSIGGFLFAGYPFVVVLIPRVLHDLTAFLFYGAEELGRLRHERPALPYRIASRLRIPAVSVLPLAAIAVAYLLRWPLTAWLPSAKAPDYTLPWGLRLLDSFLIFVAVHHYWMEAVTWKGSSPYRRHFRLS